MAEEEAKTETTETTTEETNEKIQKDIDDINSKIEELKSDGNDIFESAIKTLEDERDALTAKLKKAAEQTGETIKETNQNFIDKYGMYIINSAELIGLVYIIYKLVD